MTGLDDGLRERKKQATQVALREAALRLALDRGPENV
ncbi:TetR family transcriptional regulator, partial [Brevibacterium aurantiacum]